MNNDTAVVVLSGGQDSVTCLGIALKKHSTVVAIGFHYDQKHAVELSQAAMICTELNVPFTWMTINVLSELGDSALVNTNNFVNNDVGAAHPSNKDLPASFVPNRNAMFLTAAHAYAQKIGAKHVYTGVCQTDYSGYPDCRDIFIKKLENALNTGYLTDIVFHTPLMHLTKAETFKLADDYGVLELVIEKSHTCYNGDRSVRHAWGYGCGKCPACELRANGYAKYLKMISGDQLEEHF
jgi:7-cyano-7-deazaguanine synthase